MPVYEFECRSCHAVTPDFRKSGDNSPLKCGCGGKATRIMSRVQISIDAPAASGVDDHKAKHDAWMRSDAGKAMIAEKEAEGWELRPAKTLRNR